MSKISERCPKVDAWTPVHKIDLVSNVQKGDDDTPNATQNKSHNIQQTSQFSSPRSTFQQFSIPTDTTRILRHEKDIKVTVPNALLDPLRQTDSRDDESLNNNYSRLREM